MANALADALAPYVSSWSAPEYKPPQMSAESWQYFSRWNGGKFNPSTALDLMQTYNKSYNLGLTDEQLAGGIKAFGDWHRTRFGGGLTADSNSVAVAAQSIAEALAQAGKGGYGSDFWQDIAKPGGDLSKGADAALANGQAMIQDQMKAQRADMDYGQSSFADFMIDVGAPMLMAAAGAGVFSPGGALGAAAEGAALGSGISSGAGGVTGISAGAGGATGVTGSVAGLSGGVLAPATTGGLLVGSEGFLGSTGNAIGDQILNSAGQNAIKSAVTGGDPVQGALQGAAGGLIGASGIGSGAADMVGATGDAATAITTGVNAAAGSGAMTAINGGSFSDILENSAISGVSQGAGSYVSNALDSGSNAIDRGVGGAVAGGTNATLTGGDVGTGLLTSGIAGAAGGLATDLGAGPEVSGVVQGVVGGIVNSQLQPDAVVNPPPSTTPTPTTTTRPDVSSVSFSDVIPQFVDKSVEWGTRLQQSGGI